MPSLHPIDCSPAAAWLAIGPDGAFLKAAGRFMLPPLLALPMAMLSFAF